MEWIVGVEGVEAMSGKSQQQKQPERLPCYIQSQSGIRLLPCCLFCHLADQGHFCLGKHLYAAPNKAGQCNVATAAAASPLGNPEIHHRDVDEKIYDSVI